MMVATAAMPPSRRDFSKQLPKPEADLTFEISTAVAALTTIGVVHGMVFYSPFNINIFDYANAGDFLVWSLRNPLTLLSTAVVAYFGFSGQKTRLGKMLFVVVWAAVFSAVFSFIEQGKVKAGDGRALYSEPCTIVVSEGPERYERSSITPIGSAGDVFIYFSKRLQSAYVVPKQAASSIGCPTIG